MFVFLVIKIQKTRFGTAPFYGFGSLTIFLGAKYSFAAKRKIKEGRCFVQYDK